MLRMMRVAPLDAAAVGATYRRAQDWYKKMQAKTKELASVACTKATVEKMQHKSKGIQVMSCAISAAPAKPLMHARRDRMGPNGQRIGTITTNPGEVDGIAMRAWKSIYHGNLDDLKQSAAAFMKKYDKYIYKGPEYQLQPITGKELMETCCKGKMTVAG